MKIGDRVIYRSQIDGMDGEKATVISVDASSGDIEIRFRSQFIMGEKATSWAGPESLAIDLEWLRDEKLKEIGI